MIDHIGIDVRNFEDAKKFYEQALAPLGITTIVLSMSENAHETPYAGMGKDGKPFFWFGERAGEEETATNSITPIHIAFGTESRAIVDAFYKAAIAAGGKDNGTPGVRPHYHQLYYGAFVLDADGNNIEAVCHDHP